MSGERTPNKVIIEGTKRKYHPWTWEICWTDGAVSGGFEDSPQEAMEAAKDMIRRFQP